ncbi:MAG: hypothetical protein KDK10_06695 [Maritimibacter sp.]|nr:hypothetical protein [Maritimibacter sp.]
MVRLALVFVLVCAGPAAAEPARAPVLGVAQNFGQSWAPELLDAAEAAGIRHIRDELHWDAAEVDGAYVFDQPITSYPDALATRGIGLMLITGGAHPDHDAYVTPHTSEGVAAYAAFFAEVAARFSAVEAVEVGNEMNSESFTSGPAQAADIVGRAGYYAALLEATSAAVRARRPDVRIVGGAAHSIPLAWFTALSDLGAPAAMDSVALHPYTTPPEQFRRQVALLRAVPGFETMPIEVTEIGTPEASEAPALLLKSHCQMALAGVTSLAWYPLAPRGDGFAPMIDETGALTDVGTGWQMLDEALDGLDVTDAAPDPFTYACAYGASGLLLWGAPRALSLADPALTAYDAAGRPAEVLTLAPDRPLLILSSGAAPEIGKNVLLGPQEVVADSFDQFAYPGQTGDGFDRFARVAGENVPFVLGPGQQEGGVPWTPYLTTARDGWVRLTAEFLQLSVWDEGPVEIVHAFTAPEAMNVAVEAALTPSSGTSDGVTLTLLKNGAELTRVSVVGASDLTHPDVHLAAGDLLEIVVGPGASAEGDTSDYRFTLRRVE